MAVSDRPKNPNGMVWVPIQFTHINHIVWLQCKALLEALCICPLQAQVIKHLVTAGIPQDCLPLQYLGRLLKEERTICYRTVMICWTVTGLTIVPQRSNFKS